MIDYGMGAIRSPDDPRDYPISLALQTAPEAVVPSAFAISPVPPNLDQNGHPWCVAYAVSAQRMTQQRVEHHEWRDIDEAWLYAQLSLIHI